MSSSMASTDRPVIWNYQDPRAYLRDLGTWRKATDADWSFRQAALEAGLGSSNYVQLFIGGKRQFKPATAKRVAHAFGLSRAETEFFLLLVRFIQSKDETARRNWYRDLLQKAVAHGKGQLDYARLEYFTEWYVPVVHAMASLDGFRYDAAAVAGKVVPAIRKNEAEKALRILAMLGILLPKGNSFELREAQLETTPEIRSIWIREYHQAMIRLAETSIGRWEKRYRNTSALTVTVKTAQIPWLIRKIDDFRNEIFAELLAGQAQDATVRGEVFQLNLQAFPLTSFHIQPAADKPLSASEDQP